MARPDLVVEFRPGASPFYEALAALVFPAAATLTSGASAPDHSTFDITGDIDLRARAIGSWSAPGFEVPLIFRDDAYGLHLTIDGRLGLYWWDGANEHRIESRPHLIPPYRDDAELHVRATLDVDNGSAGHTATFYTSDDGSTWEEAQQVTVASTTSIAAAATPILVGHGWLYSSTPWQGQILEIEVRNGIAGTVVTSPDFTAQAAGATSFADAQGRTWNVVGDAYLTDADGIPWMDLSDRVRSAVWTVGRAPDMDDWPPGEAQLVFENADRHLDPDNGSGPYAGQLLPRVPFRIRSTDDAGATYDDLFYGYCEDGFEQSYAAPADGTCQVRLVDLLGVLSGYTLRGVFESAVLRYGPVGYWHLSVDSDATDVADLGSGGNDGRIESEPVEAPPLFPGMGASLLFDGTDDRIDITRSAVVADPWHASVVLAFSTDEPAGFTQAHVLFQQTDGRDLNPTVYDVFVHTDGKLRLQYTLGGSGGFVVESTPRVDDDAPHLVFTQSNVGGADGFGIGVDTATLDETTTIGILQAGKGVAIGGTPHSVRGYDDNYFPGRIGAVAVYPFPLPEAAREDILAARDGLDGQRSDQVVAWALDQIGVPASLRNLDEGRSIMGAPAPAGRDALEFIREVTATEYGAFYVDHADGGRLRFRERHAPWLEARATTPQAVFSDDPALAFGAVVRVEPGSLVVEANGIAPIVNRATVTWQNGEETAEDAASVAAYGPRSTTLETQASSPAAARALAQWVSRLTSEPIARIRRLGINPAAAESAFPVAIGLRIGDRVTFRSQPQATGSVVTRSLTVEGITHAVERRSWMTTFATGTAPASLVSLFLLDLSELDGTDVLAL